MRLAVKTQTRRVLLCGGSWGNSSRKCNKEDIMCFRPADSGGGPQKCPECGKPIQAMAGVKMEKCPFCKADLTGAEDGDVAPGAGAAVAVPEGPKSRIPAGMPKAPGAPKPKVPGAPKA